MLHTLEFDQKGYVKEYNYKFGFTSTQWWEGFPVQYTGAVPMPAFFWNCPVWFHLGSVCELIFLLRLAGLYDGNTLFFVIRDKSQVSKNPVQQQNMDINGSKTVSVWQKSLRLPGLTIEHILERSWKLEQYPSTIA